MGGRFAMKLLFLIFLTALAGQNSPAQQSQAPWAVVSRTPVAQPAPDANSARPRNPQSAPPRKDIPTIAKAGNGAIVSIIMSDKDGSPIAQGTGFLISKDGRIVTNYHVIKNGSSAIVKLPDGAFFVVDGVLAFDKARDVAVIKAHGENFRPLTLGNSDRLQVGEEVVAIGNPLSLESTVSNGIVSGIRTVEEEGGKFLQVTTPISPGSSGGPLFNMAGEVVGITTLYLKGGENLNFAIPINDAKQLLLAKSSKIQALPNESEPVKAQTHHGDAPPSVSVTAQTPSTPDLETTVQFMGHMVEPEHRVVLHGRLIGAQLLHGPSIITIVSNKHVSVGLPTGETHKHGYPEFIFDVYSEGDGKHEQKDYPRYMSFSLGSIDPSSIQSIVGGYDMYAIAEFWDKHPNCMADPQCNDEHFSFLQSLPRMTAVLFHTTDLKPLIERGGFEFHQACSENEKRDGQCPG